MKGNIGLVAHPSCACSKVPGTESILDTQKTIISMIILPINQAMRAPSELSATSWKLMDFGQNDIGEKVKNYLFL